MRTSARLIIPDGDDPDEFMYARGWSDGLPLVAPTPAKVAAMIDELGLPPSTRLGRCPPSLASATIERVAVSAVMAGCAPRHFRVAVAAVEAALRPEFGLHGVHATTMGATPCVVVSGAPGAGVNHSHGCLGSGARANAAIGRAVKLVLQHVGGARLGGTESTTLGSPAKYTFCVGEDLGATAAGGWTSLPASRGHRDSAGEGVVTVVATTGGPVQIVDFKLTDPDALIEHLAAAMVAAGYSRDLAPVSDCLLVVSPEHHRLLCKKYKTREGFTEALWHECNARLTPRIGSIVYQNRGALLAGLRNRPLALAVAGALVACLVSLLGFLSTALRPITGRAQSIAPKFESPASFHVVVAGGPAGKFSAFCVGFGAGRPGMPTHRMSAAVSESVRPATVPTGRAGVDIARPSALDGGMEIFDPTFTGTDGGDGSGSGERTMAEPCGNYGKGDVVGLLDISKDGGKAFLDRIEELLTTRFPGIKVLRYMKPTFSRPAPDDLIQKIAGACNLVVAGLAD